MELISIIVPVYKVEKYLCECVDSILSQTYENFELILVDDGSPDNSGKICDKYAEKDKRIKVIHKENAGVSSARNIGLDNAKGEYITFIDSDDTVDKRYLELMYKKLEETKSDLCFCHFDRFGDDAFHSSNEKPFPNFCICDTKSDEFFNFVKRFFNFKNNILGSCWRVLYKSTTINSRFNTSMIFCEDLVFILNVLLNATSFCSIDNVLYHYRTNMSSALNSYKKNFLSNQLVLQKEIISIFDNFDKKYARKIADPYFGLLCYYLFSNEIKFRKNNLVFKEKLKEIRESALYRCFTLKSILKLKKIKIFAVWILIKFRLF